MAAMDAQANPRENERYDLLMRRLVFASPHHRTQLRTISMIFTFDNKLDQTDTAYYMFIFQIKHQYSF